MKLIISKTITLSNSAIDDFILDVNTYLKENELSTSHAKKTILMIEEGLLNYQEFFGSDKECKVTLRKHFSKVVIDIDIIGQPADPFDENTSEFANLIVDKLDIEPNYSYSKKVNHLSATIKKEKNVFLYLLIGSIVFGVIFGFLGRLLSDDTAYYVTYILEKISSSILGVLSMIAGPLIFFAIISAIIGLGNSSRFSRMARKTILHFIICDAVFMALITLLSFLIFPMNYGVSSIQGESQSTFTLIVDAIFNIVPANFFGAFVENNILQILIISILFGVASLAFLSKYPKIKDVVEIGVSLTGKIMEWFVYLLPLVIFVVIFTNIRNGIISNYMNIWILALFMFVTIILFFAGYLIIVSIRTKINIITLLKQVFPALILSLLTGSSVSTLPDTIDNLIRSFSIRKEYSRFSASTGIVFFVPDSILIFASTIFYCAMTTSTSVNFSWMLMAFIMCILFGVAAPPIVGGYAAVLTIMCTSLNIPSDALAVAIPLVIIFDYFCTGVKVGILQLDIILQSKNLGMIEE